MAMATVTEEVTKICKNICDNFCEYRDKCGNDMDDCYCDEVREKGGCPLDKLYDMFGTN